MSSTTQNNTVDITIYKYISQCTFCKQCCEKLQWLNQYNFLVSITVLFPVKMPCKILYTCYNICTGYVIKGKALTIVQAQRWQKLTHFCELPLEDDNTIGGRLENLGTNW